MQTLAFSELPFNFRPLFPGMTRAARAFVPANDSRRYSLRGQIGMVVFAVLDFISRSLLRMGVNQCGEHAAIMNIPRSGCCLDNQLGIGIFNHMALRPIEALLLALAAKVGLGDQGSTGRYRYGHHRLHDEYVPA